MNSKQLNNVIDSVIFNPVSHRDSFGLIDENGKRYTDIKKYVLARNDVDREYRFIYKSVSQQRKTEHFYDVLKQVKILQLWRKVE